MKKLAFGISAILVVAIIAVGAVFALPLGQGPEIAQGKTVALDENNGDASSSPPFPQHLPESKLSKKIFIRYAPGKQPSGPVCGNGICEKGENWRKCPKDCPQSTPTPTPMPTPTPTPTTSCYAFFSGAEPKWNWIDNYVYAEGLAIVTRDATNSWDSLTSAEIFGFGAKANYPWGVYDGYNAISFGNYTDPDVIAVTAVWYLSSFIYEYDIMFDLDYFPNGQELYYDLETVALHEFGHAAGLDDLYTTACSDQVMYGYYSGERLSFGSGDIRGIKILYGP